MIEAPGYKALNWTTIVLTIEDGQLEEVQYHQYWKYGVEMNIKCISPLHILTEGGFDEMILIGYEPARSIMGLVSL